MAGSSPRMWGTDRLERRPGFLARFIPTHVGNGIGISLFAILDTVHPHACGERLDSCAQSDSDNGSSPRMWGTVAHRALVSTTVRFIPTHVGNGYSKWEPMLRNAVHPHACGERF